MISNVIDGFFDAATARNIAMGQMAGNNLLLTEINTIQVAINTVAAGGNLQAIVGPKVGATASSAMGVSADYFNGWNDPYSYDTPAHKIARANMTAVINYFTKLGYAITRSREGITTTFNWLIEW